MELWDCYDKNQVTQKDILLVRGKPIQDGQYHLVVHACLFNNNNEMLIQKRQANKNIFPGLWDFSVGGSALTGENIHQAMQRETREEIGLELNFSLVQPAMMMTFDHGFDYYFVGKIRESIEELKIQKEEVQEVCFASLESIEKLLEEKKFVPYKKSFVELLFACLDGYGEWSKKV